MSAVVGGTDRCPTCGSDSPTTMVTGTPQNPDRERCSDAWHRLLALALREDTLEEDLLRCMEVRNLALEEAALSIQTGGDGQDYLDRSRMIRGWLEAAYERHAEGERAHQLTDGPIPIGAGTQCPECGGRVKGFVANFLRRCANDWHDDGINPLVGGEAGGA